jgi:hypothetical protein
MPDEPGYDWKDDAQKCYRVAIDHMRAQKHPTLCQCGQPLKTEDRSHGIFTLCCGRQLESCCGE